MFSKGHIEAGLGDYSSKYIRGSMIKQRVFVLFLAISKQKLSAN